MEAKPYKIPHPFRKLNKDLIDRIVKDIDEGSTHRLASESNGITSRIFDIWRLQGKIDLEHEEDSLCAYLVLSLSKVKQKEVKICRQAIVDSEKGHKGAEWTLEHAYWRDYGNDANAKELAEEIERMKDELRNGDHDGKAHSSKKKKNPKK
jgi:hypothetical protein